MGLIILIKTFRRDIYNVAYFPTGVFHQTIIDTHNQTLLVPDYTRWEYRAQVALVDWVPIF